MLHSDALGQGANLMQFNINSITLDAMLNIQKELEPYDMVSMVFLLYDTPDTALQRLLTYQRVNNDVDSNNLNLLYEWALYAQSRPMGVTWRYEFLEALTVCRLYNIIKKLGFNVSNLKEHYQPENIHTSVHIHPVKKLLYRLCENVTSDILIKLKETFISYEIDVTEHEYCEMVFLELMCKKFIVLNYSNKEIKSPYNSCSFKRTKLKELAKIIENYHGFKNYALQLRELERKLNNDPVFSSLDTTTGVSKTKVDDVKTGSGNVYPEDFRDIDQLLSQMNLDDIPIKNLKSDTLHLNDNFYPIINPKRLGLCCIINQEKFHPSKGSINTQNGNNVLTDRLGSRSDHNALKETMKNLNFIVKSGHNLKYNEIFEFVRKCIKSSIPEDSMFVLCILSHGVKGHIYSSDSMKVKVDDIQNMLDSDDALHLRGKPKILILQACRVNETSITPSTRLVSDSASTDYYLRKSHFLVYWATAPEYEAFRDEKLGSIFIQTLCYILKKIAHKEQLCDICTIVTDYVTNFCTKKQYVQVPLFESSLRKKLYLCDPKKIILNKVISESQ